MLIKNVNIYTEEHEFLPGTIQIVNGVIQKVNLSAENDAILADETVIDGNNAYAIPGMIDIHFHGCKGYDFCDGTREAFDEIAKYEASIGVTAIAPATMTLPVAELENILAEAATYKKEQEVSEENYTRADLVGINMEGPFISKVKKGAQNQKHIIPCDTATFRKFQIAAEGLVKFIGIAPEEGNAVEFTRDVKDSVNVSLAHTNADYDSAKEAFQVGANHVVHMYNAMPEYNHRAPGVIGAVFDSNHVTAELICDGIHIHPSVVRATFKMLGKERIIMISDSIRATGMNDGVYTLGGLDVEVKGNCAILISEGVMAGSVTTLPDCMRFAAKEIGIPMETVVACVSENPAKRLGIFHKYGSISEGKRGNIVLLDKELKLISVIKDGISLDKWNHR
ncbi:MAG: N-acetylglucosamine-6-phosphate deacetylase [Suipraeoptans sp.]